MSMDYISQKLMQAEYALATGLGPIRDRLCAAADYLQRTDRAERDAAPADSDFRDRFKAAVRQLTEPKDNSDDKHIRQVGSMAAACEQLGDLEAAAIAGEICELRSIATDLYEQELRRQKIHAVRKNP